MEKEFIPYEQALALKELGFDEPCLTYYNYDGNVEKSDDWAHGCTLEDKRDRNECLAPLYQQAFKWFREKYDLLHFINGIHSTDPFELDCQILNISNGSLWQLLYSGDDYEEAELECLKKLIEIVKQNINLPEIDETIDGSRI